MRWFKNRNKDSVPITEKTIRDVSDDDNPVTFATPLENEERAKELEEFANEKKDEQTDSNDELEMGIIEEVNDIALNRDLTAADKTIKIYQIYEEFQNSLSVGAKVKIINTLDVLDRQIKDEKTHDKYNDKISRLKERVTKYQKGSADSRSVSQSKESKKNDEAVDWAEVSSLLLLEAENS